MCLLSLYLDGNKEERIYGEEVGKDADDVDEDAEADKEMDLPPGLPHVQTIDVFLQCQIYPKLSQIMTMISFDLKKGEASIHMSYIVQC